MRPSFNGVEPPTTNEMPLHLVWALTNACNVRCIHCYASSAARLPDELQYDEIIQNVNILANDGLLDLAISGGEPLMVKHLNHIVEHAVGLGVNVGIGTNGWALTSTRAKELASAGVGRIQISLDGMQRTHDIVRRRAGMFDRAKRAIENSIDASLKTKVCFTIHRGNYEQLYEVFEYALELGVSGFNLSQLVATGRASKDLDLPPSQWRDILMWWHDMRRRHPEVDMSTHLAQIALVAPELTGSPMFRGCQAGMAQGAIAANGDVYPCVVLPYTVGNIRRLSVREIWTNSPVLRTLRDRRNLAVACQCCPIREKCGGCRGNAYALTSNMYESDLRCRYRPTDEHNGISYANLDDDREQRNSSGECELGSQRNDNMTS